MLKASYINRTKKVLACQPITQPTNFATLGMKDRVFNVPFQAYPVLQASLNMLTESAVTMKASAQARCPMCGFGSKIDNIQNLITEQIYIKT